MSDKPITTCVCQQCHHVNAHRADGTPVALWSCPVHGNIHEDRKYEITLDDFQENVFLELSSTESVDEISKKLNRSTSSVRRAIIFLNSVGLTKVDIGAIP